MSLRPLSVGITCYATFGGSGIVAAEVGLALARRGHRVHFIGADVPPRLDEAADDVRFHRVEPMAYPVFRHVPYAIALASKMAEVAAQEGLDVLHAHYAVPHATSAWMAREVLGARAPKVVTTLHGTDITLVGADESYLPITRHSILKSDAVTTPSAALREETWRRFGLAPADVPIDVVPNFVDTDRWRPADAADRPGLRALFGPVAAEVPTLVHTSNFRPVKRVQDVVAVFARVVATRPALLLLVGDGPERPAAEALVHRLGLADRVRFVGALDRFEALLRECRVFLLPSETESFGLAALEALASGVPVVASEVGGLPEVLRPGETGFLCPVGDVEAMADRVRALLDDPATHARMAAAARADVLARFRTGPTVDRYEAIYRRVVG